MIAAASALYRDPSISYTSLTLTWGTDGTFPRFFLALGPTPKPCQAPAAKINPLASRKSFFPWSLVPLVPWSLPLQLCRLFPAICYAQCMVSNPQSTLRNPHPGAINHDPGHTPAASKISPSAVFHSNLSGTSPVQNQRPAPPPPVSNPVVTKAEGVLFCLSFSLPARGSLLHCFTDSLTTVHCSLTTGLPPPPHPSDPTPPSLQTPPPHPSHPTPPCQCVKL